MILLINKILTELKSYGFQLIMKPEIFPINLKANNDSLNAMPYALIFE